MVSPVRFRVPPLWNMAICRINVRGLVAGFVRPTTVAPQPASWEAPGEWILVRP
jgi:hypothetical protein